MWKLIQFKNTVKNGILWPKGMFFLSNNPWGRGIDNWGNAKVLASDFELREIDKAWISQRVSK